MTHETPVHNTQSPYLPVLSRTLHLSFVIELVGMDFLVQPLVAVADDEGTHKDPTHCDRQCCRNDNANLSTFLPLLSSTGRWFPDGSWRDSSARCLPCVG